ncbi:MAG TPA: hypothetical protein VGR35_06040 [Tepidisphaeraceae bacterium]|nr:hypothetical protein [Tepidisphaeraceae bacterium]
MAERNYRVYCVRRDNGKHEIYESVAPSPEEAEQRANTAGYYVSHVVPFTAQEQAELAARAKRERLAQRLDERTTIGALLGCALLFMAFLAMNLITADWKPTVGETERAVRGHSGGGAVDLGRGYQTDRMAEERLALERRTTKAEAERLLRDGAALKRAAEMIESGER